MDGLGFLGLLVVQVNGRKVYTMESTAREMREMREMRETRVQAEANRMRFDIARAIGEKGKLNADDARAISEMYGETIDGVLRVYAAVKQQAKEAKKAMRKAALAKQYDATHCCFIYKGERVSFRVEYVTSLNALVWKGLDKNAIYFAKEKDGALVFGATATTATSNTWKKALIQGNKGKCTKALEELTRGLDFDSFLEVCRGFKNFRIRTSATKAEEAIKSL